MIVQIQEYSRQTGIGVAVDTAGDKIDFNYMQLKAQKTIPVGKKATLNGRLLSPVGNVKSVWFYVCKVVMWVRRLYE